MKADELWRTRVREAADQVLAPLITDGGKFSYDVLDYSTRRLSVSYSLKDCADCVISTEDLTGIMDEGLTRALGTPVAVQMTDLADGA